MGEQSSVDSLEMVLGSPLSPAGEGGLEVCGQVLSVHTRVDEHAAYQVRVDVGSGPSVLDVALAGGVGRRCWDTEGGGSVADTVGEGVD